MTKIGDLLAERRTISFEFFPPKDEAATQRLVRTLDELEALDPSFISVTYGAGGSTRDLTKDLVVDLDAKRSYPAMPHLTCIGHTKDELAELLQEYSAQGIANLLALAGDPPADGSEPVGDFTFASELVELAREVGDFSVGVAAFPELHPRSDTTRADRLHLAHKLSLADFGITQFFFDPDPYMRMIDDLDRLGCETPVVPGVIAPQSPSTMRRFAAINGSRIPPRLFTRLEEADEADRYRIAVDHAIELAELLVAEGAPGIHFYTLNRSEAAIEVYRRLDLG